MVTESPGTDPHCSASIGDCRWIELPVFPDQNGNLAVYDHRHAESMFRVERVFFLYDVPSMASRGGHSSFTTSQLLLAVNGSFDVTVDDGHYRETHHIDKPNRGLLIPAGIWRELDKFTPGAVCLVLASTRFAEEDYVRDYMHFLTLSQYKQRRDT